ncbi:UvrD-helicase domain-containing protein [Tepidimicrobium xylanilyticum]
MGNTKEQDLAITTIDRNLAVNAGAGTGKTKVLTERYIYILEYGDLEENKEIESIVAITFTKKATQEMKERIREELKKRFPLGGKWVRFYRDMEKANISTIHSFCANILRENPLNIGIDPMFNVLEQEEADFLLEETILEVLLEFIEKDEDIYNLIKIFNSDDLDRIAMDLKTIYYKIRTVGYSIEEVENRTLTYISGLEVDSVDLQYIKDSFVYLMENSRKNSKIYKLKDDPTWVDFYKGNYEESNLVSILESLSENIGTNAKEAERIENLQDRIHNVLLIKEKEYLWAYKGIFKLLLEIDERYTDKKYKLGSLDYDDLQILVLHLLEDESIREKLQNKFKYIMVDEFQDTNELQKKIFYRLCSNENPLDRNNLFVVGDPKQSIYGFRGADLEVFYDVIEDIEESSRGKLITLNRNFRTVDSILDFVNSLFDKLMGSRYVGLIFNRKSPNQIDVEILEKEGLTPSPNLEKKEYYAYYESRLIASRIKELVDKGEFKYGDFTLLFRATTLDDIYEDGLMEYGIPYYNTGGKGFYRRQEILDLINGLKAISNRFDTISTIGFLRSPMVGVSDTTIYWLLRHKESSLLETMDKEIEQIDPAEKEKLKKASKLLHNLMIKKGFYGIGELLTELIDTTYYLESLVLYASGRQMVSNVYKFLEVAQDFDKHNTSFLEDFIDYVETIKDSDESQAKIYSEKANVVKLMTIHKSKGLQFPVVIIPQMASGFNYNRPNILFDKEKGIGFKYDRISPSYDKIKADLKYLEEEEHKRLLYVAMTRAKDRLIIGNQGDDIGFKRLVKGLLDYDKIKVVDRIDNIINSRQIVKGLPKKLSIEGEAQQEEFLLLKTLKGYDQKVFTRVSPSQFVEFNQCRRKFFLNYYTRLSIEIDSDEIETESPIIDSITKGEIIHKFCQYYKKGINPGELMERIVNSFGLEYNRDIEQELKVYMENYIKHCSEDYDIFYTEKEFYLKVDDVYIRGKIDRINIKDGKAEILDFKTNRVCNKENLVKMYEPQIQLYANAFKRIANMEIERAAIVFLETGEMVEIRTDKESLEKNYEDLREFIRFINSNNSIGQYEKTDACETYCRYNILCTMN